MIKSFDETKDQVAQNIYNSMLDNYTPIPEYIAENKEDLLDFLKLAWVNGANWRLNQMMQNKIGIDHERRL